MIEVRRLVHVLLLVSSPFLSGLASHPAAADDRECVVVEEAKMNTETVRLVRAASSDSTGVVALFKASMAVNTDGAPTSYHPDDFLGKKLALNRIDNGIAIRTATESPSP